MFDDNIVPNKDVTYNVLYFFNALNERIPLHFVGFDDK